ncbi:phosphonate ABC transporter, permease protein PhnE [Salinicoccus sesuvii]|uniref:Phosphonate ABC transporter, permease protein PhnE n=1 Tax=Salinicoccus sesuvii TaxID=868281 RepID=A0ABV7N244_9STAP
MKKPSLNRSDRIVLTPMRFKLFILGVLLIITLLYIGAVYQTKAFPNRVVEGLPIIFFFVMDDLWPPSWKYLRSVVQPLLETWNIALFGTTFGAILALPISFLAASNINTNRFFYRIVRVFFNILRTVPEIILAVLFVALVGIGDISGILALTVLTIGIVGKLLSESVESVDVGPLEAIRASGGNTLQVIRYGVMPQILPQYASYTLYCLEINVKASVVLGFVGAGGIGIILRQQLSLFTYENVAAIIFTLFVVISIIDFISNRLRERLE